MRPFAISTVAICSTARHYMLHYVTTLLFEIKKYPRDPMLARVVAMILCPSVSVSVCLLQDGVL